MNEQIFFVVEHKELVLDKVLVQYNELPVFFVCRSGEEYFVALTLDVDVEEYIVTATTLENLSRVLHENMTMRDVFLQAQNYWHIIAGDSVEEDKVAVKDISEIPINSLPYEGEYLIVKSPDLLRYADKIDLMLYDNGVWEDKTQQLYDEDVCENTDRNFVSYDLLLEEEYEEIEGEFVVKECVSMQDFNCELEVSELNIYLVRWQYWEKFDANIFMGEAA